MRITLVWPNGLGGIDTLPMPFGYLVANTPEGHEFQIIDCALDDIWAGDPELRERIEQFKPEIVGVNAYSRTAREALAVLSVAKQIDPKIVTLIGGVHATSYPDKSMEHRDLDYLFRGEAELSFPVFLDQLASENPDWSKVLGLVYRNDDNTLTKNPMEREPNPDKIKWPDYDIIRLEEYIRRGYRYVSRHKRHAPIWATRGCPYFCQYCSAPLQNGRKIRAHSVDYLLRWIKYLYHEKNIKLVNIIDDNFTFDTDYAKEVCRAIIDLGLKDLHLSTPNGIRIERTDAELFKLMKSAGWEYVTVAPESGSKATLKKMKKGLKLEILPQKLKEIREAGLKVHGFMMVGYPGETMEDVKETQKLLRSLRFNHTYIMNFQPLPGTPIYDELVEKGEIVDGMMPRNFFNGERTYVPEGLKDFNFARFAFVNYMYIMLRDPRNIVHYLRYFNPVTATARAFAIAVNMFKGDRKERRAAARAASVPVVAPGGPPHPPS
jgi:radical SAM superfamily enzyme YgiQ (UPF0313 family)